jgi:hypothetical protein
MTAAMMQQIRDAMETVHEDNSGALVLADTLSPQFTPCGKYYAIKTIWF